MNLKEQIYSVLIVSAAENFNTVLHELLPESRYFPVKFVSSINSAKHALADRGYDYVIINSPLPDDIGIRFSIDISTSNDRVILFLVRAELQADIYDKVAEYGIFTLAKPTNRQMLTTALSWMSTTRERLRKAQKKTLSIEEKMEEIRLVNRAKWLLISELKMDEPEAHRYIEKQAMDRCISKREVAKEIIKTYS